ncbi:DUF502 domain-containing protein [Limnochorda pilosa]|uniref:Transporter n=1 Tax=Limnochorda pilosa TaxID=1555112 RepID=A0A0K2SQ96_LIMPI|nr:DUF502 domain-containing protein [Limnochorda pilosa]BAS29300.1 hypothetical protein LIP_3488 [Limnochorda pilosa]
MHRIGRWLQRTFLAGVAVLLPLVLTAYVLWFAFTRLDHLLGGLVQGLAGRPLPGVGLVATLALTVLAGLVATNLLGRRLIQTGERLLERIPGIRSLYTGTKQIITSVILPEQRHFRRAVLIPYPRAGMYSLGFVTHEEVPPSLRAPGDLVSVYVPTTPNPTSGFVVLAPRSDCIELDLTVEEAFRTIISAGLVMPERSGSRPGAAPGGEPAPH